MVTMKMPCFDPDSPKVEELEIELESEEELEYILWRSAVPSLDEEEEGT